MVRWFLVVLLSVVGCQQSTLVPTPPQKTYPLADQTIYSEGKCFNLVIGPKVLDDPEIRTLGVRECQ